jgi:hypothetical protein
MTNVSATRAWLLSLVWFVVALALFVGSTPFAYVAWALPSWLLFRKTTRWWRDAGGDGAAGRWVVRFGMVLLAGVAGLVAWENSTPDTSPASPTLADLAFTAIFILCLLFPPSVVTWVIVRSRRIGRTPA